MAKTLGVITLDYCSINWLFSVKHPMPQNWSLSIFFQHKIRYLILELEKRNTCHHKLRPATFNAILLVLLHENNTVFPDSCSFQDKFYLFYCVATLFLVHLLYDIRGIIFCHYFKAFNFIFFTYCSGCPSCSIFFCSAPARYLPLLPQNRTPPSCGRKNWYLKTLLWLCGKF